MTHGIQAFLDKLHLMKGMKILSFQRLTFDAFDIKSLGPNMEQNEMNLWQMENPNKNVHHDEASGEHPSFTF